MFENDRGFFCKTMIAVIVLGVVLRMVIGTLLTYNYDVFSWALIISNIQAGSGLYDVTGYNYPPVWGSFLAILGQFTDLLGMDVLAERFPELIYTEADVSYSPHLAYVTTLEFNAFITAIITIFDILTGYVIYWIVKDIYKDERRALICSAVWLLCPFVIVVGAVGGMFDCLSGMLVLLCIALLMKDQEFLAGSLFAVSVLLKFFPAFLFFILIAYIVVKHREDCIRRIINAALGAALFTAIIILPYVLDGHLADCFSFLTSRAETTTSTFGVLEQIGSISAYVVAIIVEIALAVWFIRKRHADLDREFVVFTFLSALMVFLYPGTPQYILFLAPILIIMAFCVESKFRIPLVMLMFGTTWFCLSTGIVDLTSVVMYSDIIPFDQWAAAYSWHQDLNIFGMDAFFAFGIIGGIIQYLAILICYYYSYKKLLYSNYKSPNDDLNKGHAQ